MDGLNGVNVNSLGSGGLFAAPATAATLLPGQQKSTLADKPAVPPYQISSPWTNSVIYLQAPIATTPTEEVVPPRTGITMALIKALSDEGIAVGSDLDAWLYYFDHFEGLSKATEKMSSQGFANPFIDPDGQIKEWAGKVIQQNRCRNEKDKIIALLKAAKGMIQYVPGSAPEALYAKATDLLKTGQAPRQNDWFILFIAAARSAGLSVEIIWDYDTEAADFDPQPRYVKKEDFAGLGESPDSIWQLLNEQGYINEQGEVRFAYFNSNQNLFPGTQFADEQKQKLQSILEGKEEPLVRPFDYQQNISCRITIGDNVYRLSSADSDLLPYTARGQVAQKYFSPIPEQQVKIWSALLEAGYIDVEGAILGKFDGKLNSFDLGAGFAAGEKERIFKVLTDAEKISGAFAFMAEQAITLHEPAIADAYVIGLPVSRSRDYLFLAIAFEYVKLKQNIQANKCITRQLINGRKNDIMALYALARLYSRIGGAMDVQTLIYKTLLQLAPLNYIANREIAGGRNNFTSVQENLNAVTNLYNVYPSLISKIIMATLRVIYLNKGQESYQIFSEIAGEIKKLHRDIVMRLISFHCQKQDLDQYLDKIGRSPENMQILGDYYQDVAGDYSAAINIYLNIIKDDPSYFPAYQSLIDRLIANDETERAYALAQKALKAAHGDETMWHALGLKLQDEFNDQEAAIKAYERAIEIDPGFLPAYITLIDLYQSKQLIRQAQDTLALAANSAAVSPENLIELGDLYQESFSDFKTAETLFRQALRLNRDYLPAYDALIANLKKQDNRRIAEVISGERELARLRAIGIDNLKTWEQVVQIGPVEVPAGTTGQLKAELAVAGIKLANEETVWSYIMKNQVLPVNVKQQLDQLGIVNPLADPEKKIAAWTEEIIEQSQAKTEKEKVQAIFLALNKAIKYDTDDKKRPNGKLTAIDVFNNKYGDCDEISSLFIRMASSAGFEAGLIFSNEAAASLSMDIDGKISVIGHAWNWVKLGAEYYELDLLEASLQLRKLSKPKVGAQKLFSDHFYQSALVNYRNMNYALANKNLGLALSIDPSSVAALLLLANAERRNGIMAANMGKTALAQRYWLSEMRALNTLHNVASSNPSDIKNVVRLFADMGEPKKAVEILENNIAKMSNDYEANYLLAALYEETKRYGNALEYYQKCSRILPRDTTTMIKIAQLQEKTGNYSEAKKNWVKLHYHRGSEGVIDPESIIKIVEMLSLPEEAEEGGRYLEEALKYLQSFEKSMFVSIYASVLISAGKVEQAEELIRNKMLSDSPTTTFFLYLIDREDAKAVIKAYDRFLAKAPSKEESSKVMLEWLLWDMTKDKSKLIALFKKMIEIRPQDPNAYLILSKMYMLFLSDQVNSERYLDMALERFPENCELHGMHLYFAQKSEQTESIQKELEFGRAHPECAVQKK
ncbi:MAG: transglutaminase domain-containing protein [Candidatus Margulisbacteria bacterium]|nr:transglutaminase domain-containing protein [Candidatus Margulisiibacteriota bacterium]